jgi:hypothetical protein
MASSTWAPHRDLSGQITAGSIGQIKTKGKAVHATITLNPSVVEHR